MTAIINPTEEKVYSALNIPANWYARGTMTFLADGIPLPDRDANEFEKGVYIHECLERKIIPLQLGIYEHEPHLITPWPWIGRDGRTIAGYKWALFQSGRIHKIEIDLELPPRIDHEEEYFKPLRKENYKLGLLELWLSKHHLRDYSRDYMLGNRL